MDFSFFVIILIFLSIITVNSTEPTLVPIAPETSTANNLPPINESEASPKLLPIDPISENKTNNDANIISDDSQNENMIENYVITGIVIAIIVVFFRIKNIPEKIFSTYQKRKIR